LTNFGTKLSCCAELAEPSIICLYIQAKNPILNKNVSHYKLLKTQFLYFAAC